MEIQCDSMVRYNKRQKVGKGWKYLHSRKDRPMSLWSAEIELKDIEVN